MPIGMVSLLGECQEQGSEGTELMGNIAGARLVAQTERGWRHRWSAVGAQPKCCWWRSRSEVSSVDGAQLVAQTERG